MRAVTQPKRKNMSKVIVVTSGKGGVGKTTTSASIACGLALKGLKTCVIDFDVGLRNLDLIMGVERRVVYDFVNVINGEASLKQALIKDKRVENLYILPASQTRDKDALTKEGVGKVIDDLKAMDFEYIICDSPAGIEQGALMALYYADEAIITTNPEVSSVRDSDRILGMGDIVSLVERAQEQFDEEEAKRLQKKIQKNKFDFNDFLKQIEQIKKMGNLKDLASMIPGVGKAIKDVDIDDNAFKGIEAIIKSMTPKERTNPEILNNSRRQRIAKGSGTNIQEVNRLIKQFDQTRKMMKMMTGTNMAKMAGMASKMKGMPGMPKL